jgi:hypothetical protein
VTFFKKFDYQTTIDYHAPYHLEISGKMFEDHVQGLFSTRNFKLAEKNHASWNDPERNTEGRKKFDFIFEHHPTRETFAVGCKYPATMNEKGQLEFHPWNN